MLFDRKITEQLERRSLELNCNFRVALRESLPGSQIKWNAYPPPVVDIELQRNERFRS